MNGEPQRLVYVVPPSPYFAGVERVVHEVASGLCDKFATQFEVHVIYSTHYAELEGLRLPYRLHELGVDRLRRFFFPLRRALREIRPDVLVVAQVEPSVVCWFAKWGLRVPHFITHIHGNPLVEERDGSAPTIVAFKVFRHLIARFTSAVFVVAPSMVPVLSSDLARHTRVIYAMNPRRAIEGVSTDGGRASTGSPFTFLTIGRLALQKNQQALLRAAAVLASEGLDFRVLVVGDGPDSVVLRDLARDLDLTGTVVFTGHQTDTGSYLQVADCFVLTSKWEGFPLVVLEALSAGLPVVAVDCDFGPRDIIKDNWIGHLVDSDEPAEIAGAMREAMLVGYEADAARRRRQLAETYSREHAATSHSAAVLDAQHHASGRAGSRPRCRAKEDHAR